MSAPALAAMLITGCGFLGASPPDPTATTTTAESTTSTTSTQSEDTTGNGGEGTTTSSQPPNTQVSVRVPRLPAGSARDGDLVDFEDCVPISYLGEEPIPPGVALRVTSASFEPPFLTRGGAACSDDEVPCLDPDFAFVANPDSAGDTCFIPVQGQGERPDDEEEDVIDERVVLTLAGAAECAPGDQALCDEFASVATGDGRSIQLDIRLLDTTSATSSSSSSSSSESSEESSPSGASKAPPD